MSGSLGSVPLGRVVPLDGGLATELERAGEDLSGGLWSAAVLRENPSAIRAVHAAFFAAGAEVATTATYQLSGMSLRRAGFDPAELDSLVRRAVSLAMEARDELCPDGWVAGSIGPYGASLADGSEYTGGYGIGSGSAGARVLRDFHRPRMEALVNAGVDVLAVETLPSAVEAEAVAAELDLLDVPAWFSFTCAPGGLTTRVGEPLSTVSELLRDVPGLVAVGVNCCAPTDVLPALGELQAGVPAIVYPNSGETWDAPAQTWRGSPSWDDGLVQQWVGAGARLIGGCCRVTPTQLATALSG